MGVKRVAIPLVGATVVMVLAGCSSTKSSSTATNQPTTNVTNTSSVPTTTASDAAPSTATSVSSQGTSASTSTPAASPTTGHEISDLVGTGGQISTDKMPTAKPEWIARIQQTDVFGNKIDPKSRNLIALVDEAARDHDLYGLVRLSSGQMTQTQLSQPGVLDGLVTLLEKTHAGPTDGLNYPAFSMGDKSATSAADLKALGVATAADYKGVTTYFRSGMGAPLTWTGVVLPR